MRYELLCHKNNTDFNAMNREIKILAQKTCISDIIESYGFTIFTLFRYFFNDPYSPFLNYLVT